jgi:hypothetical protein
MAFRLQWWVSEKPLLPDSQWGTRTQLHVQSLPTNIQPCKTIYGFYETRIAVSAPTCQRHGMGQKAMKK